jgi:hypothetical protein
LFSKEDSSFSEEKEAKRLLSIWLRTVRLPKTCAKRIKVFCFFFTKKKNLPSLATMGLRNDQRVRPNLAQLHQPAAAPQLRGLGR